ncbi:MAG: phosphodiester glycosidase family protein [Anaerolineae bacterium]|nr:phosphodiester glycosidase family protein [Anaerolineae bacterium]
MQGYDCQQKQVTYADGLKADISLVRCRPEQLRFQDIPLADPLVRLRDATRLRYYKARIRGEADPVVIGWACLEDDQPVQHMFPTLQTTSRSGEHFISTNSFVTYVLRVLLARGWLRFRRGEWCPEIPTGYPAWEETAVIVLQWLMAEQRIWLETGPGQTIPDKTRFENCDPLLHLTPVGRCGCIRDIARRQMPAAAFNASFFLLEHDDYVSHHSALGDPYGLLVVAGEIIRPPLYRRSTLWQDAQGGWHIDTLGMADIRLHLPGGMTLYPPGSAADGPQFALNPAGEVPLALYTRAFSTAPDGFTAGSTPDSPGRFELTIIDRRVVSWQRGGGLEIPQNGFVLSIQAAREGEPLTEIGDLHEALAAIQVLLQNGEIRYSFDQPAWQGMTAAQQNGPELMRDGQITITDSSFPHEEYILSRETDQGYEIGVVPTEFPTDAAETRAARLGIGINAAGDLIVLAISGSSKGVARPGIDSAGATLVELAEQLEAAGAVEAINLDGGGSVQLFVEGGLYNNPGDRRGRQGVTYERMVPTIGLVE